MHPGFQHLIRQLCAAESGIHDVQTQVYNLDDGVKDSISAGQTQLSTLFLFSLTYFGSNSFASVLIQ